MKDKTILKAVKIFLITTGFVALGIGIILLAIIALFLWYFTA